MHTYPVYTSACFILKNSNRSFYAYCSLYAPLSLLPTCCLRRTSRRLLAFLCRLRLLHHLDEPASTLGCVCMGGDSPCFSRGHRSVLRPPGGELSFALGHAAFSPCPYSVTGLSIGYIGDSYLLSGVMVRSMPFPFLPFVINNYWIFSKNTLQINTTPL